VVSVDFELPHKNCLVFNFDIINETNVVVVSFRTFVDSKLVHLDRNKISCFKGVVKIQAVLRFAKSFLLN